METRLRRTFRYPEGDEPDTMDEEEQEQFIDKLRNENIEHNQSWIYIILCLLIISEILYTFFLIVLWKPIPKLTLLVGSSSILATAYDLTTIPPEYGGNDPLASFAAKYSIEMSSLQRLLPFLNAILAVLAGISGSVWKDAAGSHYQMRFVSWVPLVMYGMVFGVKLFLVEVNPAELEKVKYGWKGA